MAGTITYNAVKNNIAYVFRATSGGTVFSANLAASANFDYFEDTAVANDAIYFGNNSFVSMSDLYLYIGTPLVGTNVVLAFEYYSSGLGGWKTCHNLTDGSSGLTVAGAVTIQYPLQAKSDWKTTVNGVSNVQWIRCRIVSLSSISEGGANSTNKPQYADGFVNINGYTDVSPCTWDAVYSWMVTNAPQCLPNKIATTVFKFDNVSFNISSTLRSNGETVFIGNGHSCGIYFNNLWSGTKIGTNGWTTPSDYFICLTGQSNVLGLSASTRIYGGRIDYFTNYVNGASCVPSGAYFGIQHGELIGVCVSHSGYFLDATCDRCTVDGQLITSNNPSVYPTNLNIANPLSFLWSIYGNSVYISSVNYAMPSLSIFNFSLQYSAQGSIMNFVNINPAFPAQTDSVKVFSRSLGTLANFSKVFFYNNGLASYTDYTAPASDSTVNDVPLSGNVGDCLYFQISTTASMSTLPAITFTKATEENDFVYVWEYYQGSTWVQISNLLVFDNTANLTKSGVIYFGMPGNWGTLTTVNGVSANWLRMRIIASGSASPTFSKAQLRLQTGIGNYKIYEKYSFDLHIQDVGGNAISGANVVIINSDGETVASLITDSFGNIIQQILTRKYTYFDPSVSETHYNGADHNYTYTVVITKAGYQAKSMVYSINQKRADIVSLEKCVDVITTIDGSQLINLTPENNQNNSDWQEV